jgi:hypothetical protein
MSAKPVIVWVTSGTAAKLARVASQRGLCSEEAGGDLLTTALRVSQTYPPLSAERTC